MRCNKRTDRRNPEVTKLITYYGLWHIFSRTFAVVQCSTYLVLSSIARAAYTRSCIICLQATDFVHWAVCLHFIFTLHTIPQSSRSCRLLSPPITKVAQTRPTLVSVLHRSPQIQLRMDSSFSFWMYMAATVTTKKGAMVESEKFPTMNVLQRYRPMHWIRSLQIGETHLTTVVYI